MNLKEFDAKQFLLEKGERVGLGIAVTLMVLMLVFSLFMPSKGFFSGSPAKNAEVLEQGSKQLQNALNSAQPTERDLPGKASELIALDTTRLKADFYEDLVWFEPTRSDNPARRPPTIKNIAEAAVSVDRVPVDTYIFSQKFDRIMVLKEQGAARANPTNTRGQNNFAKLYQGMQPPGMSGSGSGSAQMKRQMGMMTNLSGRGVLGADEKPEYDTVLVKLTDVDPGSARLARQLRPARMAIIAASFPYKAQLDEFRSKLRLSSIQDVLSDTVEDGKDKLPAFRFLGVQVQREELDANGKVVSAWSDMDLGASYKLWMLNSGLPFEPDDPKYDAIKFSGLVMPRLREFHEESPQGMGGMMPPGPGGQSQGPPDVPRRDGDSKYLDVAGQLKDIQATLEKLAGATPRQIAAPPAQFRGAQNFDPFNPMATAAPEATEPTPPPPDKGGDKADPQDITVPEHCLVRLVDVTIEPGKFYRYRVKVRMANPNYNRADVASPAYKVAKELVSKDWVEVPKTVTVPMETFYYVVDQKHVRGDGPKGGDKPLKGTPMYDIWRYEPKADQVVFQFQRWVESTPVVSEGEPVPIGEWAVADRVFVNRGEYVGQKVRVDLPVWKYTQDSFVLPAEDQKKRGQKRPPTGVVVDFGAENSDRETILVDFEGGKRSFELPVPVVEGAAPAKPARVDDVSAIEVVMLSPEGKLLARNSAADTNDDARQKHRTKYFRRIREIREGKPGAGGPGTGGLDK